MKKFYLFHFRFFILLKALLFLLLFISCSSSEDTTNTENEETIPANQTPEFLCKKEKEDNSEICGQKGDSCTNACRTMYSNSTEIAKCIKLTSQQVGVLTNIHITLTSGNKSNLQNLSNKEETSNLSCYSSIGFTGWIHWIKTTIRTEQAKNILEWLAENSNITSILIGSSDLGKNIIKDLLFKALPNNISIPDKAISTATIGTFTGSHDSTDLWVFKYDTLEIITANPAVPKKIIFTSNDNTNLYISLSHFIFNKATDNLLSYSAGQNNSNLFNMIFSVLSEICDSTGSNNNEALACKKTLLCWTNQRQNKKIWNIIENNDNQKEVLGGEEFFKDCKAEAFARLF